MGKRIAIVNDCAIIRAALRALLSSKNDESNGDWEITGEAVFGPEAIRLIESQRPDLILFDPFCEKDLAIISKIKKDSPDTKILVFFEREFLINIGEAFWMKLDGCVLKNDGSGEFFQAIEVLFSGQRYLSSRIEEMVFINCLDKKGASKCLVRRDTLTRRERETLRLVVAGHRNKEIAAYFGISVKTIEKHRANLMRKLNLHSASALTAYAIRKGLAKKRT